MSEPHDKLVQDLVVAGAGSFTGLWVQYVNPSIQVFLILGAAVITVLTIYNRILDIKTKRLKLKELEEDT